MEQLIDGITKEQAMLLGLFALGCLSALYGAVSVLRALRAKNWPTAPGLVTMSAVEVKYHYSKGRRRKSETHVFFYNYGVDDDIHTGSRIVFGFTTRSARKLFQLYPPNKEIWVYYNPNKPTECCLEPDRLIGGIAAIIVGAGFFAYAIYLTVSMNVG